jgi:concanavalin A-like lectin/glucanase superfamily protein
VRHRGARRKATSASQLGTWLAIVIAAVVGGTVWAASGHASARLNRGGTTYHSSAGGTTACQPSSAVPPPPGTDAYDRQVLSLGPVMYLTLAHPSSQGEPDLSGHGHNGLYQPVNNLPGTTALPNGDPAAKFDGQAQYVQVPSAPDLSVTHTGCLTVEAWVQPDTLQFPREQGSGYVYILGKGVTGQQEYALRMYSMTNSEVPPRPNRVSAYAFNLSGGLGSGAYFQDPVQIGAWMMVTFVIDDQSSAAWPAGYIAIYKNSLLRGQVSLSQFQVTPQAGSAPFRIATRDLDSYFEGAIGKVAIYNYVLSASQIQATYKAMF